MKAYAINLLLVFFVVCILVAAFEYFLRGMFGLGDPVLYDNNPVYGYRLLPNQHKLRFRGAEIHVNNLGLRCDQDWDAGAEGKMLFLGDSVTYGGSYISNAQLFSTLAATDTGYQSCNAGVNAWGIDNIHGLVVESGFMPAGTYVTAVPEGDFYRGLTRMQGMPYFNIKPRFALEELLQFWFWKQGNRRYIEWENPAAAELKHDVVDRAADHLRAVDDTLKQNGFRHYLFISPTRKQSLDGAPRDKLVESALIARGLRAVYIADELKNLRAARADLYVDSVHLSPAGHQAWANIIRSQLFGGRLKGR